MPNKPDVAALLEKYTAEEAALTARIAEIEAELATSKDRLKEVATLCAVLGDATDAPAKSAAPKKAKPAAKAAAAKPAAKKAAAKAKPSAKKGRTKGRRKANAKGVHALGIVDAAHYLAKEKGIEVADAGMVLAWFEEAGFKTRSGTPNRNSVYVSLNREAGVERKEGEQLISRPERGKFKFHF